MGAPSRYLNASVATYSSIAPPPLRGVALCLYGSESEEVERFDVVGLVTVSEEHFTKQRTENERWPNYSWNIASREDLIAHGYASQSVDTYFAAVILALDEDYTDPRDGGLHILDRSGHFYKYHSIVWCTWPEDEDKHNLQSHILALRRRAVNAPVE